MGLHLAFTMFSQIQLRNGAPKPRLPLLFTCLIAKILDPLLSKPRTDQTDPGKHTGPRNRPESLAGTLTAPSAYNLRDSPVFHRHTEVLNQLKSGFEMVNTCENHVFYVVFFGCCTVWDRVRGPEFDR